jgi:hypothetical protein
MLTDCVFWFILCPYILIHHESLNYVSTHLSAIFFHFVRQLMNVLLLLLQPKMVMHSVNILFLLGDAVLNSLVHSDHPLSLEMMLLPFDRSRNN